MVALVGVTAVFVQTLKEVVRFAFCASGKEAISMNVDDEPRGASGFNLVVAFHNMSSSNQLNVMQLLQALWMLLF